MSLSRVEKLLIKHEVLRLKPYKDTAGKLTIGVGHNLDDNGITQEEAYYLLHNDVTNCLIELSQFDFFKNLNEAREDVLINMAFNLGISKLLQFNEMIKAIKDKDYKKAAEEMLNSDWARQVNGRAYELAQMMEKGEYLYEP